jgi:folylpolyglutamate synthase/dihydropteroate synthase
LGEHQKSMPRSRWPPWKYCKANSCRRKNPRRAGDVNWPGRLQLIQKPNGQKILLDGAHNVAGAKVLREALGEKFFGGEAHANSWRASGQGLAAHLRRFSRRWRANLHRAGFKRTHRRCQGPGCGMSCRKSVVGNHCRLENLAEALDKSASDTFVIITGSLYLVGEALEMLGLSPAAGSERGLNEWSAVAPNRSSSQISCQNI